MPALRMALRVVAALLAAARCSQAARAAAALDVAVLDMNPEKPVHIDTKKGSPKRSARRKTAKVSPNKNIRRKRLHWTGIDKSRIENGDNIWSAADDMNTSDDSLIKFDDEEFERLFISVEDVTKTVSPVGEKDKKPKTDKNVMNT